MGGASVFFARVMFLFVVRYDMIRSMLTWIVLLMKKSSVVVYYKFYEYNILVRNSNA